jgi:hypothetical protein
MGGTEDGLNHQGNVHVRGDLKLNEAYAVEMVEKPSGYGVAEVVDDASPDEVISLHEWKEKNEECKRQRSERQKQNDLRRLTTSSVETNLKRSRRMEKQSSDSGEKKEDKEEERADDDLIGNKNDLINGNI